MTDFQTFLNRIIDDGIAAVREDYAKREPYWREGAIAGFEACRGKTPPELARLLSRARRVSARTHWSSLARHWRVRCFVNEVEWTCNVLSAALYNQGLPTLVPPTGRGLMKAAEILGVGSRAGA